MSLTDANAILGRGRMHVLSQEQAADLMRESLEASLEAMAPAVRAEGGAAPGVSGGGGGSNSGGGCDWAGRARGAAGVHAGGGSASPRVLLDVGAGEGEVTER